MVRATDRAAESLPVDGVAAAIIEPVAAQHTAAGRTEPRMTLFAPDAERASQFGLPEIADLEPGTVLLDDDAAEELDAAPGDRISILAGEELFDVEVAAVGDYRGTTTADSAVLLPLAVAQELLGRGGEANHVLVSNTGGDTDGVEHTAMVEEALDDALRGFGLDTQPVKQDGLDAAEESGNAFVQLFTTFGTFSMAAGVLLIFLIFVMLAAERRPEMGMARAVGTQRRHLVQTFLYEGAAYDVAAAALGALLGIVVSWVMVRAVASAFAVEGGMELGYSLSAQSLVIGSTLGVLLTLVVVTLSAWRVSRLNIVSAIRDIPESDEEVHPVRRWVFIGIGVAVGALLAVSGASSQTYVSWMLGISILIVSLVPIARILGRYERAAYTVAAATLLVLWLLPLNTFDAVFGEMSMDFSIWIVGGLMVVVAATWLVTYNADVLLGVAARLAAPFRSVRPVAKMAVAYPLKSRFRTGVTLSMFMLVVFTLVTGSTIPGAFNDSFDDVAKFGGGFDVRVSTAPVVAVPDLVAELPDEVADDIVASGAQSFVPLEVRQDGTGGEFAGYPVRGVDDGFTAATTYELSAMATGYSTAREVWDAVSAEPGLAVVDAYVAPRRDNWGFGVLPDFQLSGFFVEDGTFDPVPLTVRDPSTGAEFPVTVIGVLTDGAAYGMAGISVSDDTLVRVDLGDQAVPTIHHLAVRDGADPEQVATAVEAALLARGVEAKSYDELLSEAVGASRLFIQLVQGFMALGLVVGVAALGVITARSVVERRQQIGMLRAIGFQPELIRRSLLAETAIVALTAIGIGTALGLVISYNVIDDTRSQAAYADMRFAVPWLNLALIIGAVIVAALLTTLAPARRASRTYPAEALRYQ